MRSHARRLVGPLGPPGHPGVIAPAELGGSSLDTLETKTHIFALQKLLWTARRRDTERVAKAFLASDRPEEVRVGLAVLDCGRRIRWAERTCLCEDRGQRRLIGAITCKLRLCGICAHLRAQTWGKRLADRITGGGAQARGARLVFLTLTIANRDRLDSRVISELWAEFRELRRTTLWRGISACAATMEFTKGENGWHPHIHAILQVEPGVWLADQSAWSTAWERISGAPIMDIRPIRPTRDGIAGAVREVAKYVAKSAQIKDPLDLLELHRAIRGRRLAITTGEWRSVREPETSAELLEGEPLLDLAECQGCGEMPTVQLVEWFWSRGRYLLEQVQEARIRGDRHTLWRAPPRHRGEPYFRVLARFRSQAGRARELASIAQLFPGSATRTKLGGWPTHASACFTRPVGGAATTWSPSPTWGPGKPSSADAASSSPGSPPSGGPGTE